MMQPDRNARLAELAQERAKFEAQRLTLARRSSELVATLRVVIEALEGKADFEALENSRFRVATGALVEGIFPAFADIKRLFADIEYVKRELNELDTQKRALEK